MALQNSWIGILLSVRKPKLILTSSHERLRRSDLLLFGVILQFDITLSMSELALLLSLLNENSSRGVIF